MISDVDFHVIDKTDISKPSRDAEDDGTFYLFHCLQAFLVHNLQAAIQKVKLKSTAEMFAGADTERS